MPGNLSEQSLDARINDANNFLIESVPEACRTCDAVVHACAVLAIRKVIYGENVEPTSDGEKSTFKISLDKLNDQTNVCDGPTGISLNGQSFVCRKDAPLDKTT